MVTLYEDIVSNRKLTLIAGPCVVEDELTLDTIAQEISEIAHRHNVLAILKASYKKANRSAMDSFTGIGDTDAIAILQSIGAKYNLPTITDIHTEEEAAFAAKYVDILQIPAFLCRQTDLLIAAAKTSKIINVKKGQFMSADAMRFAVAKIHKSGNAQVLLTERGTTFGYQDLVVDFRSIPIMNQFAPAIVDCTHSLQQPNQASGVTGGNPEMIATIAKAAIAVGAKGLFIETHPNPRKALSDGANMLPISELDYLMKQLVEIKKALI